MPPPQISDNPAGLGVLAGQCETWAADLAMTMAPVTAASWQASAAGADTVGARVAAVASANAGRMRATGQRLIEAVQRLEADDEAHAGALGAVGAGAGCDGGAGAARG